MIIIDNAYYSKETEQIHVTLYNDDPAIDPYSTTINTIYLYKVIGSSQYSFDCTGIFEFTEFDANTQAHVIIPVADIPDSGTVKFSIDGVVTIEVNTTIGDISRTIWDNTEFYQYKMAIIDSEGGRNGTVRAAKKIARFSFYEQMLLAASIQGFSQDAAIYYSELKRMATYGIPTVKQEECYI